MPIKSDKTAARGAGEKAPAGRGKGPSLAAPSLSAYANRRAWLITDGKAGMDAQVLGVARALRLAYEFKTVDPGIPWRYMAPWGPVAPAEKFGRADSALFAPPWPDIAIATGRQAIPYLRALKKRAGARVFTVILQDPKLGRGAADLIWVPAHDRLRGANVITTLTAPHPFTPSRLARLRETTPVAIAALPHPRLVVVLGGPNAVYRYTGGDIERLSKALSALAGLGASFMITASRRTPEALVKAVDEATKSAPRILWTGGKDNPYGKFLAHGDHFIVTADSVNMCGEAAATGRPVWVFEPQGGSAKFDRFHKGLRAHGATRPLPGSPGALPSWDYEPLDAASIIAREIARRWSLPDRARPGGARITHVVEDD